MAEARCRVLWVCGATGAGKSAAAWSLFERRAAAGSAVAYVDVDQVGMLYPETDDDSYRFGLKSAVLGALIPGYVAAGAHTLVVSGVVDPAAGPGLEADTDLTVCLLSPGEELLRTRLVARGWDKSDLDEAAREDAALRAAGFVDIVIETDGLSIVETAARLEGLVDWARQPSAVATIKAAAPSRSEVFVITGPRAVGTSTVGFGLATRAWRSGQRAGFVDLHQLGFLAGRDGRAGSNTILSVCQLTTIHELFARRGAERLVVSAHLTAEGRTVLREAFRSVPVTIVRLRGDANAYQDHVRERTNGSGARLAADDLLDASEEYQAFVVQRALAEQALDDLVVDDAVVDVSGRTAADVVADVQAGRS